MSLMLTIDPDLIRRIDQIKPPAKGVAALLALANEGHTVKDYMIY